MIHFEELINSHVLGSKIWLDKFHPKLSPRKLTLLHFYIVIILSTLLELTLLEGNLLLLFGICSTENVS